MELCSKCVTPVMEGVSVCDVCRTYKPPEINWDKKAQELKTLLDAHKGKGGDRYDVLSPGKVKIPECSEEL